VCCATCPKKDLSGRARCKEPCQNEPTKCGSYIAYDADTSVREDFLKKKRDYYHLNAEKNREKERQRYHQNKESRSAYYKVYYAEHRDECLKKQAEWRERKKAENPRYVTEYKAKLKLKKEGEVHSAES
jgi:hypothetical protein